MLSFFYILQVRQARNAVMHTPDMKVTEPDFKAYSQSMINLLNDPNISSSPRAKDAVAQIQTVCMFCLLGQFERKWTLHMLLTSFFLNLLHNEKEIFLFFLH